MEQFAQDRADNTEEAVGFPVETTKNEGENWLLKEERGKNKA